MDLKEAIHSRKSIRSYESKSIPKDLLVSIIDAGTKAPSSQNHQPWEFYVILSKEIRDKLSKILAKSLKLYKKDFADLEPDVKKEALAFYKDLGGCQNLIFVFTTKEKNQYTLQSKIMGISAAIENILLSAVDLGLGTCWVGGFRGFQKEIKRILEIADTKELIAGILIGYPKKDYKPLTRKKKKLEEVLTFI